MSILILLSFAFSLLGHKIEDFPEIIYGSIIRIHHMSIQMYQGFLNGRVFDARSVTVVGHSEKVTIEKELSLLNKRDKTKCSLLSRQTDNFNSKFSQCPAGAAYNEFLPSRTLFSEI